MAAASPPASVAPRRSGSRADVLVVSIAATSGWRIAARELGASIARTGATVHTVAAGPLPRVRTFPLTDLVQAHAARGACRRGIAERRPRAIIYCSITAALLWPSPGAVWLDSIAAENRPGRHGIWQRVAERRRLAQTPLVLAMNETALAPLRDPHPETVTVPCPVEPSGSPQRSRDIDVITYAGDPEKRRLDLVLDSWSRARRGNETLVVAGLDRLPGASDRTLEGVQVAGRLPSAEYRALLRRARVFLAAPRREDYGIAPLEALADGCMLVSTPSPGPYPALALARSLDPRLVDQDLAGALRVALDDPVPRYAERALELLAPFRRAAVDRAIAEQVLPRLLPGWRA
ncbi:MAG: glycosyltransferase [Solirubrobacterales bacterium]|nr:glycosyltransferase [Solirubrobacterales bacterium]